VISERTILLVRERCDIQSVISETVKLVRRGRSWVGLCPFHKERSPSFHVTPERGMYHCFGCGEHGNVYTFVMRIEGMTFPEAVRRLAERAGIEIEETATEQQRKEEQAARKGKEDLYAVGHLAAHYYETMLREHPLAKVAQDELERRALVSASPTDAVANALQAFRLGYAPAGWDGLATFLRQQGVSPHTAEQAGLLLPRSSGGGHYDRFRNRLMFPVIDLQGRVVAFSGRILPDPQTGLVDKETGKYINSPETPVYRKGELVFGLFQARQSIRQAEEAVLVEGNFDVVSLHARGITNVVAPLGTAFTPEQGAMLKRFSHQVVLLFDGDAAGRKAVRSAQEPCKRAGLMAKAAVLPQGMDPDDFCRLKGAEAMQAVVKSSRGLIEHLIAATLDEGFERGDAEEKAARVREVSELLAGETDPTVRMMAGRYADDIAGRFVTRDERLGMADASTFRALVKSVEATVARVKAAGTSVQGAAAPAAKVSRDPVVEAFLGSLFDFPALLAEPAVTELLSSLDGDAVFVVAALRQIGDGEFFGLDTDEFLAKVPPSFHAFALYRLAAPEFQDIETAREKLLENAAKLKMRALTRENALDRQEAARAEAQGDDDAAMAYLREMSERARKKARLGSNKGRLGSPGKGTS
jgi:DNA primase